MCLRTKEANSAFPNSSRSGPLGSTYARVETKRGKTMTRARSIGFAMLTVAVLAVGVPQGRAEDSGVATSAFDIS